MSMGTLEKMIPESLKIEIRDYFIELMEKEGFINIRLDPNNNLKVDYDINPEQDFVKEICGNISYSIIQQKSTKETKKKYQKIKKMANKIEKQCQREALSILTKKAGAIK